MAKYGKFVSNGMVSMEESEIRSFVDMLCSLVNNKCGVPFVKCIVERKVVGGCYGGEYVHVRFLLDKAVSGRNYYGHRIREFDEACFVISKERSDTHVPNMQYTLRGVFPNVRRCEYRCKRFRFMEFRKHYFYGTEVIDFVDDVTNYLDELDEELDGVVVLNHNHKPYLEVLYSIEDVNII